LLAFVGRVREGLGLPAAPPEPGMEAAEITPAGLADDSALGSGSGTANAEPQPPAPAEPVADDDDQSNPQADEKLNTPVKTSNEAERGEAEEGSS